MNCTVTLDWKCVLVLGVAAGVVILCCKMNGESAERVLTHAVDSREDLLAD